MRPSTNIAQTVPNLQAKWPPELKIDKSLNNSSSWTAWPNSKLFHVGFSHNAHYQKCSNGSTPPIGAKDYGHTRAKN